MRNTVHESAEADTSEAVGIRSESLQSPRIMNVAEELQEAPEDEEGGSVNLKELTKAELVDYAAGQGIDLNMKMTKADMIAEIEAE